MSNTNTPRMTNPPSPDDDDEAWLEILAMEQEFWDGLEFVGEPEPVKAWKTTAHLIESLSQNGLDASGFKLPSRAWTVDEAYEELTKRGVTGDSFKLPGDQPAPLEQRWYGKK